MNDSAMNGQTSAKPATRLGFLVASVLCFLVGSLGFDVLIHFLVGGPRYGSGGSIVTVLFLYAPFAALALMAASVEKKTSRNRAVAFFGFFVCVLGWLYFRGCLSAEMAMTQKKWTAAALSIGLLPFKSVPVLAVAGVVGFLCSRSILPSAKPSFRARSLALIVTVLRIKRMWDPERLEKTIADDRKQGPAPPPKKLGKTCAISSYESGGRTVYEIQPLGAAPACDVFYLHGGGRVLSIQGPHWDFIGKLVRTLNARVTIPLYPLGPVHTLHETWEMLLPLYGELAKREGVRRLILMGDSAGGGLALSLAQQARDSGLSRPSCLVLLSPALDFTFSDPTQPKIDDVDPIMSLRGMPMLARMHAGSLDLRDPLVSPLFGSMHNLPPLAVLTGTRDILHPDALKLKAKVETEGGGIRYLEYSDMLHVWPLFPLPEAATALEQTRTFILKTLS